MMSLIRDLNAMYAINVKYARCDNIGENEDFASACKQEGMGVKFR